MRPTREMLHMLTAMLWASRATCKRPNRHIGCVITDASMRQIISFGYNGPPTALGNHACPGTTSTCGCVHAEINALVKRTDHSPSQVMFVTMAPCLQCANAIAQGGIWKVIYKDNYRNIDGIARLVACGVLVEQMSVEPRILEALSSLLIPRQTD